MENKILFTQLNKDCKPVKFDGFGFQIPFVDGLAIRRPDGKDVCLMYTGYKITIPNGYIGQVYDLDITTLASVQRMQLVQFVTNDFEYPKDEKEALGFFIPYEITGGFFSKILDKEKPYIGINFFKIHGIQDYSVSVDIKSDIQKPSEKVDNPQIT